MARVFIFLFRAESLNHKDPGRTSGPGPSGWLLTHLAVFTRSALEEVASFLRILLDELFDFIHHQTAFLRVTEEVGE